MPLRLTVKKFCLATNDEGDLYLHLELNSEHVVQATAATVNTWEPAWLHDPTGWTAVVNAQSVVSTAEAAVAAAQNNANTTPNNQATANADLSAAITELAAAKSQYLVAIHKRLTEVEKSGSTIEVTIPDSGDIVLSVSPASKTRGSTLKL